MHRYQLHKMLNEAGKFLTRKMLILDQNRCTLRYVMSIEK